MNARVDAFIDRAKQWKPEFEQLRAIALESGLEEGLKWGQPCYMLEDKNVFLIHGFKEYCALLFFKGALLNDPNGILLQQTENVQSARQIRFKDVKEIAKKKSAIKAIIREAIEAEKAGLKVQLKKPAEFAMPEEFAQRLAKNKALKKAFESLTPGRQRAYLLHFSSAKQSQTREARVEKAIPAIMDGKGLNE